MPSLPWRKRKSPADPEKQNGVAPHTDGTMNSSDTEAASSPDHPTAPHAGTAPTKEELHRATKTRASFSWLSSIFLIISLVFLILVEIGNTHTHGALPQIYFFKLDLSNIAPVSIPNAQLLNSIARTLGLHDYYTVGLWNFCEGYFGDSVSCIKPKPMWWFNPVEIIESELIAGASIPIPAEVVTYLNLLRLASHWMFGLFLAGTCLVAVLIFVDWMSVYSRWAALVISLFTLLAAIFVTVATVIASVIAIIFTKAAKSQTQLHIGANIGKPMFAFMWIASAFAILAFIIQVGLCCCCASRRDVKHGWKGPRRNRKKE